MVKTNTRKAQRKIGIPEEMKHYQHTVERKSYSTVPQENKELQSEVVVV